MYLYIARHGQTGGNVGSDRSQDPFLTELGRRQAEALGRRMSKIRLDAVICSLLTRSVETAAPTARMQAGGPIPVEILADMSENGTMPWYPGRPMAELNAICPTAVACPDPAPDGGRAWCLPEKERNFLERAQRVILYVKSRWDVDSDAKILLVGHGGFNQKLLAAALGLGAVEDTSFSQDNGCLNLVHFSHHKKDGEEHSRLVFANDVSHLVNAGISTGNRFDPASQIEA